MKKKLNLFYWSLPVLFAILWLLQTLLFTSDPCFTTSRILSRKADFGTVSEGGDDCVLPRHYVGIMYMALHSALY